ncbi:MAG: hypothetical protein ACFE0S_17875 [Rhodospirillales bacterium]
MKMTEDEEIAEILQSIEQEALVVPVTRAILIREQKDLFQYWTELRGRHFAPRWDAFEFDKAPPRLVPHFAAVEVGRDPLDFVFVHWGPGRVKMQRVDYTGKSLREFWPENIARKAIRENCEVLARRAPLCIQPIKLKGEGADTFDYQLMRLPFSDDGVEITHILTSGLYDEDEIGKAFEL